MVQRKEKTTWDQRVQKRLSVWAVCCIVIFYVLKRPDVHTGLGDWLWGYFNRGVIVSGIISFLISGSIGLNELSKRFNWKGAGIKFIQALSEVKDKENDSDNPNN